MTVHTTIQSRLPCLQLLFLFVCSTLFSISNVDPQNQRRLSQISMLSIWYTPETRNLSSSYDSWYTRLILYLSSCFYDQTNLHSIMIRRHHCYDIIFLRIRLIELDRNNPHTKSSINFPLYSLTTSKTKRNETICKPISLTTCWSSLHSQKITESL